MNLQWVVPIYKIWNKAYCLMLHLPKKYTLEMIWESAVINHNFILGLPFYNSTLSNKLSKKWQKRLFFSVKKRQSSDSVSPSKRLVDMQAEKKKMMEGLTKTIRCVLQKKVFNF